MEDYHNGQSDIQLPSCNPSEMLSRQEFGEEQSVTELHHENEASASGDVGSGLPAELSGQANSSHLLDWQGVASQQPFDAAPQRQSASEPGPSLAQVGSPQCLVPFLLESSLVCKSQPRWANMY